MANMMRCPDGHFYDAAKHTTCPWCGVGPDPAGGGADQGKTRRVQDAHAAVSAQASAPAAAPAAGVTRRIVPSSRDEKAGFDPVVGWLVCVEGPDRGRDYRLRTAKNFIGRGSNMDVCVAGDENVSREKHAVVAFDPEERKFWLFPGEAQGLVYLNGGIVHTPAELHSDDVVRVGQTKLMFIPFCGDRHQWQ